MEIGELLHQRLSGLHPVCFLFSKHTVEFCRNDAVVLQLCRHSCGKLGMYFCMLHFLAIQRSLQFCELTFLLCTQIKPARQHIDHVLAMAPAVFACSLLVMI